MSDVPNDVGRSGERSTAVDVDLLRSRIRSIDDWPRPGVSFKDITPLLGDADAFDRVLEAMAKPWRAMRVSHVVGIESRGFIVGAPVAALVASVVGGEAW